MNSLSELSSRAEQIVREANDAESRDLVFVCSAGKSRFLHAPMDRETDPSAWSE
jgi:hypothetical protein